MLKALRLYLGALERKKAQREIEGSIHEFRR